MYSGCVFQATGVDLRGNGASGGGAALTAMDRVPVVFDWEPCAQVDLR